MWRLLLFLVAVAAAAFAIVQVVQTPGVLTLQWFGYRIETSMLVAGLALAAGAVALIVFWSGLHWVITRPAALSGYMKEKREERGLEALSRGLVAVGSGDSAQAQRYAELARRRLPNEPLTALLRAQAAQLRGDRAEARRIFEAMVEAPDTELLGLRGLFLEAKREEETEAARQFAERAMQRNPDLAWSVNALFEIQCRAGDWEGALKTLEVARRQDQIERDAASRRRAVLLTAQAREAEESDIDRARELALEAHKLAPDLVPAADIAGRLLVSQGSISKAMKVLARTWELAPHPDLALAYAHVRPGDSPRERLKRAQRLADTAPDHIESAVAVASAAIEARAWDEARAALQPFLESRPQARVCTLMARIESGQTGDAGRVREWLARAVRAARDPAWTADGYASAEWLPVSPVTGALDAFVWKAPLEPIGRMDQAGLEDFARGAVRERPAHEEPGEAVPAAAGEAAAGDGAGDAGRDTQAGGPADDAAVARVAEPIRPPDDPGPEAAPEETAEEEAYPAQPR